MDEVYSNIVQVRARHYARALRHVRHRLPMTGRTGRNFSRPGTDNARVLYQEDGGAELIAFSWDGPRSRDDQLQGMLLRACYAMSGTSRGYW
eukprot:3221828-Rhodomonas_salina.2